MVAIPRNFLVVPWQTKFLKTAVIYNMAVFGTFFLAYAFLDFSKHFTSDAPVTKRGKLYFSVMAHTAVGTNDIVPKTDVARMVVATHVIFAWMQLLLVFVT